MKSKYPRVSDRIKPNQKSKAGQGRPCRICQTATTAKVVMEVNSFRGDDDLLAICEHHANDEILALYGVKIENSAN